MTDKTNLTWSLKIIQARSIFFYYTIIGQIFLIDDYWHIYIPRILCSSRKYMRKWHFTTILHGVNFIQLKWIRWIPLINIRLQVVFRKNTLKIPNIDRQKSATSVKLLPTITFLVNLLTSLQPSVIMINRGYCPRNTVHPLLT